MDSCFFILILLMGVALGILFALIPPVTGVAVISSELQWS